jgi:hypothetical protein
LFTILAHNRGRRFQPDTDAASLIDIGTLGGNAPDDILGRQYRCHRRHLDTQLRNSCSHRCKTLIDCKRAIVFA